MQKLGKAVVANGSKTLYNHRNGWDLRYRRGGAMDMPITRITADVPEHPEIAAYAVYEPTRKRISIYRNASADDGAKIIKLFTTKIQQ